MLSEKSVSVAKEFVEYINGCTGTRIVLKGGFALKLCYGIEPVMLDKIEFNTCCEACEINSLVKLFVQQKPYKYDIKNTDKSTLLTLCIGTEDADVFSVVFYKYYRDESSMDWTLINGIVVSSLSDLMSNCIDGERKGSNIQDLTNIILIYDKYSSDINPATKIKLKSYIDYMGANCLLASIDCFCSKDTALSRDKYYKGLIKMCEGLGCDIQFIYNV